VIARKEREGEMQASFSSRFINLAAALATGGALLLAHAGGAQAGAGTIARVSIPEQTMQVLIDGQSAFRWKVSAAAGGHVTPTGTFRPTLMHKMWYSRKYDNAPMPRRPRPSVRQIPVS
jgi:hypothetical protein